MSGWYDNLGGARVGSQDNTFLKERLLFVGVRLTQTEMRTLHFSVYVLSVKIYPARNRGKVRLLYLTALISELSSSELTRQNITPPHKTLSFSPPLHSDLSHRPLKIIPSHLPPTRQSMMFSLLSPPLTRDQ